MNIGDTVYSNFYDGITWHKYTITYINSTPPEGFPKMCHVVSSTNSVSHSPVRSTNYVVLTSDILTKEQFIDNQINSILK